MFNERIQRTQIVTDTVDKNTMEIMTFKQQKYLIFFWVCIMVIIGDRIGYGIITELTVPSYLQAGVETNLICDFDDNLESVLNFFWSKSEQDHTDRSDTETLLAYLKNTDQWHDQTNGQMSATMDIANLRSTLTIHSPNVSEHDLRYWCIIQLTFEILEASGGATVADSGSVELMCTEETNTCSASKFSPRTDFTLEWLRDGHQIEETNSTESDGSYFSATSSITNVEPGNYTCCASGDAYYFESSKKICKSCVIEDRGGSLLAVIIISSIIGFIVGLICISGCIYVIIRYKKPISNPESPNTEPPNAGSLLVDKPENEDIGTNQSNTDIQPEDKKDNKQEAEKI